MGSFCHLHRNYFWPGVLSKQFASEVARRCAFSQLILGCLCGVWEDLGGCLAWLSPPTACDLAPLQVCNLIELALDRRVPCLLQ